MIFQSDLYIYICYSIDVLSLFWSWLSSDYSFIFILSCDCVRQTSANQYPTCGSPDLYLLWHLDLYLLCDLYLCMLKCRDLYLLYSDDCVGWSGANQSGSCVFSSQTCRETFNPVFSILCTNIPQIWDICTVFVFCFVFLISDLPRKFKLIIFNSSPTKLYKIMRVSFEQPSLYLNLSFWRHWRFQKRELNLLNPLLAPFWETPCRENKMMIHFAFS